MATDPVTFTMDYEIDVMEEPDVEEPIKIDAIRTDELNEDPGAEDFNDRTRTVLWRWMLPGLQDTGYKFA